MIDKIVQDYSALLKSIGIDNQIIEHPNLPKAAEVLSFMGLTMADGSATMIMKADNEFIAVVRRDDCQIDFGKIKKILGVKNLRFANIGEFVRVMKIPIGTARVYTPGLKTLLDKKLFEREFLNGGSGNFTCSIRCKAEDYKKIPNSHVADTTEDNKLINDTTNRKRILSGIAPSGDGSLHIGNYLGMVKQSIEFAKSYDCFLFVADLHALTTIQDKATLEKNIENLVLNELALLGDLTNITFFRQSDVPMHAELQTILNNITPLGLLRRAHAYKDKLQKETSEDEINLGLFNYPILMSADILLYKPDYVPVGKDQKQHIEICRDLAQRFNKTYKTNIFPLPEPFIPEQVAVIMGTDGKRKMAKSIGNVISMFEDEKMIKKQVISIYTDPTRIHPTDHGHIEGNMVFTYLDFFGEKERVEELKELYKKGKIADVEVKNYLLESLLKYFAPARKRYRELLVHPEKVKKILQEGAQRAREVASQTMKEVRETIGLTNKYSFFEY